MKKLRGMEIRNTEPENKNGKLGRRRKKQKENVLRCCSPPLESRTPPISSFTSPETDNIVFYEVFMKLRIQWTTYLGREVVRQGDMVEMYGDMYGMEGHLP